MNLKEITIKRRTIKEYDTTKNLSKKEWDEIIDFGHNSPTSMNWQTWRAIVVDRDSRTADLITEKHMFYNAKHIKMANKTVFYVVPKKEQFEKGELQRKRIAESIHLRSIKKGNPIEIKNIPKELIDEGQQGINSWLNNKELEPWAAKQSYIGASFMVIAAASLSIDTTIMEGFNSKSLDDLFISNELINKDETISLAVSFGHRSSLPVAPTMRDPKKYKFKNAK